MWTTIVVDVECIVCKKTLHKLRHNSTEALRKMKRIASNSRRSRTPNWSQEEKQYLLELIKNRKEVVVPKNSNGPNHCEEKDTAWNEILRELSLRFGSKFSGSSIKKVKTQWQNMKRIARDEVAANGSAVQNYTRQSMEVCHILDMVQDGIPRIETELATSSRIFPTIEIKTEIVDEDSETKNYDESTEMDSNLCEARETRTPESSFFMSDQQSEADNNGPEEMAANAVLNQPIPLQKDASAMTDSTMEEFLNPFHRHLQECIRYTTNEKELKMETLKEERQVVRAMRETAELNKIISEQKLKHVLWLKKKDLM